MASATSSGGTTGRPRTEDGRRAATAAGACARCSTSSGPTFVKFGQLLSTRPDVVPPDILAELRGLQDDAHPEPFDRIRPVVEAELGLTIEQVFAGVRRDAHRGRVDRPGAPGPAARRAAGGGQGPAPRRRAPDSTPTSSCSTRWPASRRTGCGGSSSSTWWGRSTSSPGRSGASSTTASRPATPRSSAATSPATRPGGGAEGLLAVQHVPGAHDGAGRGDGARQARPRRRGRPTTASGSGTGSPRRGCRWSSSTASSTPTRIRRTSWCATPTSISLVDFGMTEQLTQRDREAAVRLLLDILNQDSERLPRRLRALGVRYPRQMEEELADRLGGHRPALLGVGDRRDRRPRGAARDLPDDLPPRTSRCRRGG